jgi:hypothetical protein
MNVILIGIAQLLSPITMMTKEEVHYGEVHFCSFCESFQFRYGDYYCAKLALPVAESGYCDLFKKEGKPTPEKPTITVVQKTCANCVYNMGGMCGKTGELTKKKACTMYSDTVAPIEIVLLKECTTCVDAYYDESNIAMCRRFNAQLDMSDLTACPEYMEDSNEGIENSNKQG